MKRRIFCSLPLLLTVALGSASAFPGKGQDTNAAPDANLLTLGTAIRLALDNNPEIRALEAGVAAGRGEVITARTWDNPELTVGAGLFRESGPPTTYNAHGDLELRQTILFPGKRALLRAGAEKGLNARQLALAGFRTQLAIQVRRAFYELLAARKVVALKEQRVTLAKSFVEAARKKVEGGFAPEFEQTKAEVEVAAAQRALREAQAQEAVAGTVLNSLAGRAPDAPLAVAGTLNENAFVPDQAMLLDEALARNPSLKIQAAQVERAGLSLALTKKSRLPDFNVGPSIDYQQKPEQLFRLGVSLPLPLWDKKKGAIASATAEQQRALAELEALRRDVLREVSSAAQLLKAARDSLAIYTPEFRAKLKSVLDAAAQSYAEGRTSLLIFLETQRTYYDTETGYFETLQKLYDAQAKLESALGVSLDQLSQSRTEPK